MNAHAREQGDYRFAIGLVMGAAVGVGLMIWLAPRVAAEVRQRMNDSAKSLRHQASEQYEQASTRVGEAVDELTRKGQGVRDDVADAVARGAHKVERYATAAMSDRS